MISATSSVNFTSAWRCAVSVAGALPFVSGRVCLPATYKPQVACGPSGTGVQNAQSSSAAAVYSGFCGEVVGHRCSTLHRRLSASVTSRELGRNSPAVSRRRVQFANSTCSPFRSRTTPTASACETPDSKRLVSRKNRSSSERAPLMTSGKCISTSIWRSASRKRICRIVWASKATSCNGSSPAADGSEPGRFKWNTVLPSTN